MKPKHFGTDGIRGIGFTELSAKLALHLGNALKEALKSDKVVIGMDTRSSSQMLAHMVASGALLSGLDVYFAGVVSTPMIAHYSKLKGITGIMITASHNPYQDNGIKVFDKGYKSKVSEELIIENYIDNEIINKADLFGTFLLADDVELEYLKLIEKLELNESNLKIIFDSANGANHLITSKIVKKYFTNGIHIANEPNGLNINRDCGSTNLVQIKDKIKSSNADLGFAYDGDGDRVIMIGSNGTIYDGDFIILLIAKYLKKHNLLKNNGVVLTKMSNPGILKALEKNGIDYVLTDVGDKYVHDAMIKHNYILGGEASGHVIINHLLHSGDGLLSSLYILKLLEEENISLDKLASEVELYPFLMNNIKNINKDVLKSEEVIKYLDKTKKEFEKNDIFLIRPSGTEPLIRVTISCKDNLKLEKHMNETVEFIKERGKLL